MPVSVLPVFPQIPDRNGQPLQSGNIYIGTANLDPISNPIAVFYDAAMTISAAQPLRTSGGFIVDGSGSPTNVYAAGDFSILVTDRNGVTLYSAPSYGFRVFSDAITFNTLVINTSIVPDAAGGATNGSNALPWTSVTSRDVLAKNVQVFRTTQPASSLDFNKLDQLCLPLAACKQTSAAASPTVGFSNIKNCASMTHPALGTYSVTFTVPIPDTSIPVGTATIGGVIVAASVAVGGLTAAVVTKLHDGTSVDCPFSLVIFGAAGVADPIS